MEKTSIDKQAGAFDKVLKLFGPKTTGLLTALVMDRGMYNPRKDGDATFGVDTIKDLFTGNMSYLRAINLAMNAGVGYMGGKALSKGNNLEGIRELMEAPKKDVFIGAAMGIPTAIQAGKTYINNGGDATPPWFKYLLGGGALGLGALALAKYLGSKSEINITDRPKYKLHIPGKKGDPTTAAEVEMPLDDLGFSPSLVEGLNRAVRVRARKNIRANSFKRNPETGKLMPYEDWEKLYGPKARAAQTAADNAQQEKAAGTREGAEQLGIGLTTVGSYHLGKILGELARDKNLIPEVINNHIDAKLTGGLVGAIAPHLLGAGLGTMLGARTKEDQEEHDEGTSFLEYLVPGYAAYQAARRAKARRAEESKPKAPSYEEDEFGDEDLDKVAGMMTPPPMAGPMPGPGVPPTPAPTPVTGPSRPVPPSLNAPAQGLGNTPMRQPASDAVQSALAMIRQIQQNAKRPQ